MLPQGLSRVWRAIMLPFFVTACGLAQDFPKNSAPAALITTPAAYYSSPRGKYLGGKYKDNLDRLAGRIVRNAKTANLQFANNIASVGGIGFFTHSATKLSDERYLEVILGAPDAFETKADYAAKVFRLFGLYGTELLTILASDAEIYQEKEVSGYGLNLTWRSIVPDGSNTRVTLERAVVYFPKERVRSFLRHESNQNNLLAEAVIFAAEEGGPMRLVSYRPQDPKPDFRPPIQDETLAVPKPKPDSLASQAVVAQFPPTGNKPAETGGQKKSEPASGPQQFESRVPAANKITPPHTVSEEKTDKPVQDQIALPLDKPRADTRAKKAEPVAALSEKEAAAEPKDAPATAAKAQREDASEMNTKQESGAVGVKSAEAAGIKSEIKTGMAGKPAQAPLAQPNFQAPVVKAGNEQIARLKKEPTAAEKESAPRPSRKALEGYVIQLAFENQADAQRWAEKMERRGYVVSLTEAGGASVRLRLGNFPLREEAERQLRVLKRDGLTGIVLNLPQAYRPDGRAPVIATEHADGAPARQ